MLQARFIKVFLGVAGVAMLLWIWSISPRPTTAGSRLPAPELALPMQPNGPPTPLSSLKGKVVLLDFWATWCGPCRMSIPDLEAVYKKYRAQGLEVVGVSRDHAETRGQIPAAAQALGITYPLVVSDDIPDINENYNVDSLPTLIMIDRQGNIAGVQTGYHAPGDLEAKVITLLKEQP